ncbi:LytR C-terminal domain-containing protein [Patescibacteria group bacterium]|nr:LytR C-terminal domain-containing protein [Patescibacteria group bacterium]
MEIGQESQSHEVQSVGQQAGVRQEGVPENTKVSFPGNRKKKKVNGKLIIIVIAVILLGVLGYFLLRDQEFVLSPQEPSPTPTEKLTPTSTPTSKPVNKEEIRIEVLNGTGIGGQAAFLQEELEKLGFTDIEVGNADAQDNSETQVIFERSVADEVKEEITEILKELYKDVDVSTSSLEGFDVQITAGLKKDQSFPTEAPVATSTPSPAVTTTITPTVTVTPTPTPQ